MKQKLRVLTEENAISKITAGDVNTALSVINRMSRRKSSRMRKTQTAAKTASPN